MLNSHLNRVFRNRRNYEIHTIIRHLRTHCVTYLPRGSVNYESRRVSPAGEVEVEFDEIIEKPKPNNVHKDIRSVDSVDPVILKYTNIINELRNEEHIQEKVFVTNFGSIRFDNDNVPSVHGQYDSVHGPDAKVLLEKKLSSVGFKTDVEDIRSVIDHDSSHENKFVSHATIPSTEESGTSVAQNTSKEGGEPYTATSVNDTVLSGNNNVNFIDDIYFGTAVERYSKTHDPQSKESSQTTMISNDDMNDLNYIDECIFGSSIMRHADDHDHNANVSQKVINNDREQSSAKQEPYDRNLGYIDEVYFQDSLETLNENQKLAADIPEVSDNLEKYLSDSKLESRTEDIDRETRADSFTSTEHGKNSTPAVQPYIQTSKEGETPDSHVKKEKTTPKSPVADALPKSAFEYVVKKRKELHEKSHGMDTKPGGEGRKGLNKILSLLNEKKKENVTKYEIIKLLKNSVIYDKYDIVGLYKHYGMSMHGGSNSPYHVLLDYLPDLARHLDAEELYPIHRLDANTTGVLLMARTPAMAETLKEMFKERRLKKTYWAITKGVPSPLQGVIDIPIAEGVIGGRRRMVLTPNVEGLKASRNSHMAVTTFRVLGKSNSAALVELSPMTGVKHQLRVHLGFGLSCPVLGDHKYSHLRKLAPQRLSGDILDHLMLKQSKVRELPMFLHSRSILLPEIMNGRNIMIEAKLPAFFNKGLSYLGLNKKLNQMRYEGHRSLD